MSKVTNLADRDGWARKDRRAGKPAWMEGLQDAIEELDELERCLRQLRPQSRWSAQQWMIATTHFRMLLVGASKRLNDLQRTNPAGNEGSLRRGLEINDACIEAGLFLRQIDVCLDALHRADSNPAERVRETEIFSSARSALLKALRRIRHLTNRDIGT
jgi:hypothetical protein